jgi:hypothetical protein
MGNRYLSTAPARTRIGAGAVLGCIGIIVLACVPALLWRYYRYGTGPLPGSWLLALTVIALVGLGFCGWAFRLVTGRWRSDGGLMSPWALRIAGTVFFLFAIFALIEREWTIVAAILPELGFGVACFALARVRERHSTRSPPEDRS